MISPCILICSLDPDSGLCLGCGRNLDEIANWGSLGDHDRRTVMESLPERLQSLGSRIDNASPSMGGDAA